MENKIQMRDNCSEEAQSVLVPVLEYWCIQHYFCLNCFFLLAILKYEQNNCYTVLAQRQIQNSVELYFLCCTFQFQFLQLTFLPQNSVDSEML